MKITGYESTILNITEDDPLANMPEESGRKRPIVILRLRTDAGIEGIGVTLWGGDLTASLRSASNATGRACAALISAWRLGRFGRVVNKGWCRGL